MAANNCLNSSRWGLKFSQQLAANPVCSGRHIDQELQPLYLNSKNICVITKKVSVIGLLEEIFFLCFVIQSLLPLTLLVSEIQSASHSLKYSNFKLL